MLERIDGDLKAALKSSDKVTLSVMRLLKSALKYRQIEKGGDLTDDDLTAVVSSMVKQRRESIEQFSGAGREDLAEQERRELEVLQRYLPRQFSQDELDEIILEAIRESGASGAADMGKVMRVLMPRVKGAADGRVVNSRVRELLQSRQ